MLLLSGCLFRPPDDLYRLPEMSAGYDQLNETIRAVRSSLEAEYGVSTDVATIVSGDNTATIQLQDLDGDGERESAVTFLQVPGVEKSLKIYIFRNILSIILRLYFVPSKCQTSPSANSLFSSCKI